ncbi:MAG: NUDIX hydrolase [Candidatus Nomurabacteria bacterium]|nr:NUDIX hydrolase [Candidatus Nomurabacteria bacterium]
MKLLLVIKDKDIFPNEVSKEDVVYKIRSAVKAIVKDSHGKIALVGTKYRLLPGGGVEEGETFVNAVKRECREEVGCNIEIDKEIGFTEEYRAQIERHQQTHFFLAHVVGEKGKPETTQNDEQGIEVDWYELDSAIALLEKEVIEIPFLSYHSCFNVRTHLVILRELKKLAE